MIPKKKTFLQVKVDTWLTGTIVDVQYETDHEFNIKGNNKISDAIKIFILLDGYGEPKSTGWMGFTYSENSNIYKLFIRELVENAKPYMQFDADLLKGMKIKVMYSQDGEYQNLKMVRPVDQKLFANNPPLKESTDIAEVIENQDDLEVPF